MQCFVFNFFAEQYRSHVHLLLVETITENYLPIVTFLLNGDERFITNNGILQSSLWGQRYHASKVSSTLAKFCFFLSQCRLGNSAFVSGVLILLFKCQYLSWDKKYYYLKFTRHKEMQWIIDGKEYLTHQWKVVHLFYFWIVSASISCKGILLITRISSQLKTCS